MTFDPSALPPLTKTTFWAIIHQDISGEVVNQLLAYYLGYRFDAPTQTWYLAKVDASWAEAYPEPPDFIANRPPHR